nr:PREDICTED: uncharacterized protein LOC107982342 [Anolis carolinensis]|eukprot:XP_016846303.1 PREDICTED: uncharacterized protein LOC107982342 [Anolis carolinensis]
MQRIELAPLLKMPLCPGDSWCLIDYKWFKKWQRYVGFESWDLYYAGKHDYYPGPIDNSKLVADSETQALKRYSIEGVDYEVIPIEAWNKLVNWYGCIERQRPIERKVVEYGEYFKYCRVEIYPSESKPSQNNDSVNLVRSQFKPVEDSAEYGGIVNLQKKLSQSQLEIHYVAEVNVSPVAEVPIQCHSDTGVEQAEVIGDLEVPVINENDLFEHRGEINTVIKNNSLKSDCAFTKDLPEKDGNMKLLGANRKNNVVPSKDEKEDEVLKEFWEMTDSICSVVTSVVITSTEHGQQVWPEENLPQENTRFGQFELLCAGEPKGPTNTPKKMDILSLWIIAKRREPRNQQKLFFNGESSEDFNAAEIDSFNYHQFTFDVPQKCLGLCFRVSVLSRERSSSPLRGLSSGARPRLSPCPILPILCYLDVASVSKDPPPLVEGFLYGTSGSPWVLLSPRFSTPEERERLLYPTNGKAATVQNFGRIRLIATLPHPKSI